MYNDEHLSICAVIAARNEFHYLRLLLPELASQKIDVVILDNESSDESCSLYQQLKGDPIVEVVSMPYDGSFSLLDQLGYKNEMILDLKYDWYIHQHADELLHHREYHSLRKAIEEAHLSGHNCLNFDEFVFIPEPDVEYEESDFYGKMLRYYFFEPAPNRLNRVFKKIENLDLISQAGHRLSGDNLKIYPVNHVLRHYITLSQAHILNKYLQRVFDARDVARGWHSNRRQFTATKLVLPTHSPVLNKWNPANPSRWDRSSPQRLHFWDW